MSPVLVSPAMFRRQSGRARAGPPGLSASAPGARAALPLPLPAVAELAEAPVAVSIRDAKGSPEDRKWIQGVYREYLNDLSSLNTGIFPVLGEYGHREPDLLARWFADDKSHPLLILKSDEPAGFALVVRPQPTLRPQGTPVDYRMSEFFVLARHRRLGVGRDAAKLIFNRFAGQWEVTEYLRNTGAVGFWRRVIAAYTKGRYTERVQDGEVRQVFRTTSDR